MSGVPDRLRASLAERYRIDAEVGRGRDGTRLSGA